MVQAARKRKPKTAAVYRAGYSCPVDPAAAHAELEAVRKSNDGVLKPADVVEVARPDDATLHPVFTWDDEAAAELWRQDEARRLIRNVCVVEVGTEADTPKAEPRPVYIHTRAPEGIDVQGYRTVSAVMNDDDLKKSAITEALSQLKGWQRRYGWLKELAAVSEAIDRVAEETASRGM